MCALRHYRSIQPVSLANQYRLDIKPKRPTPRKLFRPKKKVDGCGAETGEGGLEGRGEGGQAGTVMADYSQQNDMGYMVATIDDFEEFDFDEDDDYLDVPPSKLDLAQRYYVQACQDLGVMPIKCIHDGLVRDDLTCKNVTMQTADAKAANIALLGSSRVESITFSNNAMGPESGRYFGDMIDRNCYLTDVTIVWNRLGSLGAESICNSLIKNNTVKKLDLTGNGFNEKDAGVFKELLVENAAIQELYLGHNYFREEGGELIGAGLAQNDTILVLDLSWNHLRLRGAMAIGSAMEKNTGLEVLNISWNGFSLEGLAMIGQKNTGLEVLNISWNGFSMEGLAMIGQGLARNSTLLELDIGCNRTTDICLPKFLMGLQRNSTLKKLKMPNNHITNNGAMTILELLKQHKTIAVDYIDFGDQCVREDFVALIDELKKTKDIRIKHGTVWSKDREPIGKHDQSEDELALLNENPHFVLMEFMRLQKLRLVDLFHQMDKDNKSRRSIEPSTNDQSEDELALLNENPHFVLMEFMRLQKLRLVDLFHQMDKDNSKGISVSEFKTGLTAVDIPLKRKTLEKFVKACDSNKNGEIDYFELMEANRQYKEHLREQVKSAEPIESSSIGRIQKLLRKIMIANGSLRHRPDMQPEQTQAKAQTKDTKAK